MSEDESFGQFMRFYALVRNAYFLNSQEVPLEACTLYGQGKDELVNGLASHFQTQLEIAPLLEFSGLELVIVELSLLLLSLHRAEFSGLVGEAMDNLSYCERETLQHYFTLAIEKEENPDHKLRILRAVSSIASSDS